jgi:hypothetical protein
MSARGDAREVVCTPLPTEAPIVIERTVVVTRIVEVVATATSAPPTPAPTPTRMTDLPGTRDLSIVPRPPQSHITRYATTRKLLFLDYAFSRDEIDGGQLVEFFTAAMENYGWEMVRLETDDERYSLSFEPGANAEAPATGVDYVRILIKGDIAEISVIVNTIREVEDWESFLSS